MSKPEKITVSYYYFDTLAKYLGPLYPDIDFNEFRNELLERWEGQRHVVFSLTDWELQYENGKYAQDWSEEYLETLKIVLKEFGEPDTGCTTPGVSKVCIMV